MGSLGGPGGTTLSNSMYHSLIQKKVEAVLKDFHKLQKVFFLDLVNTLSNKMSSEAAQTNFMSDYLEKSEKLKKRLNSLINNNNDYFSPKVQGKKSRSRVLDQISKLLKISGCSEIVDPRPFQSPKSGSRGPRKRSQRSPKDPVGRVDRQRDRLFSKDRKKEKPVNPKIDQAPVVVRQITISDGVYDPKTVKISNKGKRMISPNNGGFAAHKAVKFKKGFQLGPEEPVRVGLDAEKTKNGRNSQNWQSGAHSGKLAQREVNEVHGSPHGGVKIDGDVSVGWDSMLIQNRPQNQSPENQQNMTRNDDSNPLLSTFQRRRPDQGSDTRPTSKEQIQREILSHHNTPKNIKNLTRNGQERLTGHPNDGLISPSGSPDVTGFASMLDRALSGTQLKNDKIPNPVAPGPNNGLNRSIRSPGANPYLNPGPSPGRMDNQPNRRIGPNRQYSPGSKSLKPARGGPPRTKVITNIAFDGKNVLRVNITIQQIGDKQAPGAPRTALNGARRFNQMPVNDRSRQISVPGRGRVNTTPSRPGVDGRLPNGSSSVFTPAFGNRKPSPRLRFHENGPGINLTRNPESRDLYSSKAMVMQNVKKAIRKFNVGGDQSKSPKIFLSFTQS